MLQDIKIIIEELIVNIQMEIFSALKYDILNYQKIKEILDNSLK